MEVLDGIVIGLLLYLTWVMVASFVVLNSGDSNIDAFLDGVTKCRWWRKSGVKTKRRFVRTFCHYPTPLHKQLADMEWKEHPFSRITVTGVTFEQACEALADMRTHVQASIH